MKKNYNKNTVKNIIFRLISLSILIACYHYNFMCNAYAEGATEALEMIFKIVAGLVTVMGAIFALFGIVHYASANSEGDGPGKQKAMLQISAGVMLVVVSALIKASAGTFAELLTY